MLSARRVSLRVVVQPWSAEATCARRLFSERKAGPPNNANQGHQSQAGAERKPSSSTATAQTSTSIKNAPYKAVPAKPSLIEQLFPEEAKRYEEKQQQPATREIPRLPLERLQHPEQSTYIPRPAKTQAEGVLGTELTRKERKAEERLREMKAAEAPGTAVLVLRNASNNLTEEDFRRLIPQAKHIEGWTLQDGDILRVVPGRDMGTLAPNNVYYILFTSQLSAHTYQWHVMRIHKLAALHTPTSNTSPIPPPPGYMIEGLDAHAAIQAYTLVPPRQKLELRQLNRPFPRSIQSIVHFEGHRRIIQRPNKLPFEVRMTLEGPQLNANLIRHIMLETGKRRNLGWSGGDGYAMQVTKWEPAASPSAGDDSEFAAKNAPGVREGHLLGLSGGQLSDAKVNDARLRRTPLDVYILGFHTESAAQSFIGHWHKRPLELPDTRASWTEEDLPPIAHVEMLW